MFVGRSQELELLSALVDGARGDRSVVAALIDGEPGIGKSRLVSEARSASPMESIVSVEAYETERVLPFAAGRSLLAAIANASPRAEALIRPLLAGTRDHERPHAALLEAAQRSLAYIEPVLVTVDDLQWWDDRSIALVHHLLRGGRADGQVIGLIAAGRPSPESAAFARSLGRLLGDNLVRLRLAPLDRDDAMSLAAALAPSLDGPSRQELWRRSGGNPFWLELLASSHDEEDVERAVASRLRGATPDAALLLSTLVLLGRPILPDELSTIHGWVPARSLEAANELCSTGLVVFEGSALAVAHDLVRSAADRQVADLDRRHTHHRLAAWLEADPAAEPSCLLAALDHKRRAGVPVHRVVERILRDSRRRVLGREGATLLLEAIDANPANQVDVDLEQAAVEFAGEVGLHSVALERWKRLADRLPTPEARALALLAAADAAQALERGEEAKQLLARARAIGVDDLTLDIGLDVSEASVLRWSDHRPEESHRLAMRALERAREDAAAHGIDKLSSGVRHAYLRALSLAFANAQQSTPRDMVSVADEIALVAAGFDDRAMAESQLRSGVALLFGQRPAEGERRLQTGWAEARRALLPDLALDAGNWLVRARYVLGRLVEGDEIVQECELLAARMGEITRPLLQARLIGHVIEISRRSPSVGLEALRALAATERDPHYRLEVHERIATWLARLQGQAAADETRKHLDSARADAESAACGRCFGQLLLAGADASARTGDTARAERWIRDWEADTQFASAQGWLAQRAHASVAMAMGPNAQETLEKTAEMAAKLDRKLEEVWARLDLAAIMPTSRRNVAAEMLYTARELATRIGAITEQRVAEQRLRNAGVRLWRRKPRDATSEQLAGLSERELEVARLISQGATNPEIAEALFLSRKTVERHVSNTLAKLEVKNRAELAAKVATLTAGATGGASKPSP